MSADRRHSETAARARQVPYPSWTAIAVEVRRTVGSGDRADPRPGKAWHDLLADGTSESEVKKRPLR